MEETVRMELENVGIHTTVYMQMLISRRRLTMISAIRLRWRAPSGSFFLRADFGGDAATMVQVSRLFESRRPKWLILYFCRLEARRLIVNGATPFEFEQVVQKS